MVALGLLAVGVGCGAPEDGDVPGHGGPSRNSTASLHLDQTVEARVRGENPARALYLRNIDVCRAAGSALVELGPEEVQQAGTSRVQVWIGEGRAAYRVEHFDPVREGPDADGRPSCVYYLASRGVHAYFDEKRSVRLQLDTGEREEGPPSDQHAVWRRGTGEATGAEPDTRTIGGQSCRPSEHPAYPGVSFCTWTGGAPWGYASTRDEPYVASDLERPFSATIVLEQDPGNTPRPALKVTTHALHVGGALDEAMSPRPASAWPAAKERP